MVAVTIGSSFYVNNEPAPTDLLFLILLMVAPFYKGFAIRFDMNPVLVFSMFGFLFATILSILASVIDRQPGFVLVPSVVHWAVTIYMFLIWYVVSTLIRGYGLPMIGLIKCSFLFATCAAALVGILVHLGIVPNEALALQVSRIRIQGTFKDPNVYASFLASGLVWLLISLIINRKWLLLKLGLLCLVMVGLVGGFSRGAFVNVLVSIAAFFVLRSMISLGTRWLKRFVTLLLLAVLVGGPLTWWYLRDTGLSDFFSQRLELQNYDNKRFSTTLEALGRLDEFPFGAGPGQAGVVLDQNTHNQYVNVLFEYGVLGGVSFYLFVMTTVWIALSGVLRRGPYSMLYATFLAILTGALVNSLVIDSLHWRHLFLFLALPIGLAGYERAQSARPARPASWTPVPRPPVRPRPVDQAG